MNREAIFESWAPPAGVWSLWARPILFAQMGNAASEPGGDAAWRAIDVSWAPAASGGTVVVVDLPGGESVLTGLALAERGLRPVPLFNACTGLHEVINQGPIIEALRAGAAFLAGRALEGAPPAFLLDARREGPAGQPAPGAFDNRWKVFPQDLPSAAFLTGRGLTRALLVQRDRLGPAEDLAHVLRRWQDGGMTIEALDVAGAGQAVPITVDRPPWYRSAWQRVLAILGLRRCSWGGFGNVVPQPSHG